MSLAPGSELFDQFCVELDAGDQPLYRGGERITGNVRIKLKKEVAIQIIRIQFKGRAVQKDFKKKKDVEQIFFNKDFVLLERPPGNLEPGNFSWKADFKYSLPFQFILPLSCPSSFEGPDGFMRYFTRVTFETSDSKAVYVAKKLFSVYDLETIAAVDPSYEEPYTYRHTFSSGGCCCKRQVYMELVMPKRVFYGGEDIEGRMVVDNIADDKISKNIQYNIVERIMRPEVSDEESLKYPARIIKSAKVDGTNVEKRKKQIVIGSLLIPAAAPVSLPNAVALAALPKDKSSPQLSPDDQASKLFEHESIISQTHKEPIFRVHYALQLLIGNFVVEVPFALKPVESEEVRHLLKQKESTNVQLKNAEVAQPAAKDTHKSGAQFIEPDEHDMIFVDEPITFVPVVPIYSAKPSDACVSDWPQLGTFAQNGKLIWHPDKKPTKEQKAEQERLKKEAQKAKKLQQKEELKAAKQAKKQKKTDKQLLVVTGDPEGDPLIVNTELAPTEPQPTSAHSTPAVVEIQSPSASQPQPESSTAAEVDEPEKAAVEKPKKKNRETIRQEKLEAKRVKAEQKLAKKQSKEAKKREAEQRKIDEKKAKQQAKEEQKRLKREEAEQKKQAKLEAKNKKKAEKEPLIEATVAPDVPGPSESERVHSTVVVTETIIEEHKGDAEPTVSVTRVVTEQKGNEEPVTTKVEVTGGEELLVNSIHSAQTAALEPQPIIEEVVIVSNGHHSKASLNGHDEIHENGTNGKLDSEVEANGHLSESGDAAMSLKKKNADQDHQLQTEA